MRRLAAAVPALVVLVGLYLIATSGGGQQAQPAPHSSPPPAIDTGPQRAITPVRTSPRPPTPGARTPGSPTAPPRSRPAPRPPRPVITASRTDCRWRHYRDGALGSDPSCAPGALDPAVIGRTARTICNRSWLASAGAPHLPPATREKLVIEYQLPGPVTGYVVARVVPVEDGGSPTDPRNLYVLPLNGWGGERTQAIVADRLHEEICAHKLTVTRAARTLEGDWLGRRVPVD